MQGGTSEPWVYEGEDHIPFFINGPSRVKFKGADSVTRKGYATFTSDTDPTLDASNTVQEGDLWINTSDNSRGYLRKDGDWFAAYHFFLRGASITHATSFCYVGYSGWVGANGNGATNVYGVCPRFSI